MTIHRSQAIKDSLSEWCIDVIKNVSAFTTDNGSNIVKAVKEDLEKIHLHSVSKLIMGLQAKIETKHCEVYKDCFRSSVNYRHIQNRMNKHLLINHSYYYERDNFLHLFT